VSEGREWFVTKILITGIIMSSLQISFSPVEFGFSWHAKERRYHDPNSAGFYTRLNNKSIYITEDYNLNRDKIFTIIRDGEIIYSGKIDTKHFARQLFKNLEIK
jgi:hypothetical protein